MVCAAGEASAPHTENHSLVEWRGFPLYAVCVTIPGKPVNFLMKSHLEGCWKDFSMTLSPDFSSLKRVDSSTNGSRLMTA